MKLTVSTVVSKSLETPYISEVTVAPAKGVGRVERRESSNLSFSAKRPKTPDFVCFRSFSFEISCFERFPFFVFFLWIFVKIMWRNRVVSAVVSIFQLKTAKQPNWISPSWAALRIPHSPSLAHYHSLRNASRFGLTRCLRSSYLLQIYTTFSCHLTTHLGALVSPRPL